jgi:hypothetical protein
VGKQRLVAMLAAKARRASETGSAFDRLGEKQAPLADSKHP